MTRTTLVALVVACCVVAGLGLATVPGSAHVNHVEADAQHSADGTLLVEWQFVGVDGWVVVRADDDGEPGEAIGHKRVSSDDGFQTDRTVSIEEDAWADIEGSQDVWIVLHKEQDGEGFSVEDDPLVRSFGEPAGTRITVEKADEPAVVAAQGFSPDPADNGTVTVRRAELPADGFLAVHELADDARDAEESDIGPVVGVVPLDAGVHENVTVQLNDSYVAAASEQELLFATVYRGDEPFDPESTERLKAGETSVGTTFGVQFLAENASTPTPTPEEADLVSTPPPTDTEAGTTADTGADDANADGTGIGVLGAGLVVLAALLAVRRRE